MQEVEDEEVCELPLLLLLLLSALLEIFLVFADMSSAWSIADKNLSGSDNAGSACKNGIFSEKSLNGLELENGFH